MSNVNKGNAVKSSRPICIRPECNRKATKALPVCSKCSKEEREARYAEAQAIVESGNCPDCGCNIKRNSSLTGWYQCEQYGSVGFRKRDDQPSCGWQAFTR